MIVVSLIAAALSLALAAVACAGAGRRLIVRRYQHGRLLRRLVATVYGTLGLFLVGHAVIPHPDTGHLVDGIVVVALLVLGATILLLMHTRIVTPASARPRTILAIGAHPDDLEIACGGSLAMLVDAGHHVHGLVMTAGAVGGDPLRRPREAREGAHFLGLASLTVHDLPDTNLALTENRMVELMEQAINRFSPDIILTHSVHDQHQDHLAVHHATLRAARRHHSILCYESPSVTRDFNPDVFLDVGDYTDIKFQAVLAHRDQVGKSYMSRDVLASVTRFRGQQAKRSHAEAFESVRLLVNETGVL